MVWKERYEKNKQELLTSKKINSENRAIFKKFFDFQEEKLRRLNDIAVLDESCYKTLQGYIARFKNVNEWFNNKPWKTLTVTDIKRVYDALEDGIIVNRFGQRYGDRRGYYNKVFKSKPFELAGLKDKVSKALGFYTDKNRREVHFVDEENFKKIISVVKNPHHLALLWLSWDIGENINTLLQLKASNFKKHKNKNTQEEEYIIYLPKDMLKRSRKERSEVTLYNETKEYLDIVLEDLQPDDLVFNFGYRQSLKFFDSAVKRSNAICEPEGDKPSWKDLRSGMACKLWLDGWHVEDINSRLGHTPTSRQFDNYVDHLKAKRSRPKQILFQNNVKEMQNEIERLKLTNKAMFQRLDRFEKKEESEKEFVKGIVHEMVVKLRKNYKGGKK